MARDLDGSYQPSVKSRKQQEKDQRRMEYRRAIECYCDQRQLLRELRRYRPGLLRWDPALERLRVTGTFQLDDNDRILALLAASLPLQVHYRTRYWVSLTPRKQPA
jgi:hypothetical protein